MNRLFLLLALALLTHAQAATNASAPATNSTAPLLFVTTNYTAAFSNHIAELRKTLPAGFSIVISEPFVVLGDEPAEVVKRRADTTIKFAVERLKQAYFKRNPDEIINVWLFKDDASYRKHAKELFNDEPTTPFGYYSSEHRALVMNISTGGGTLVHEIVHPFMRANFPKCPPWFNEGLASLYEQSTEKDGRIHGLINWRYTGLEKAIKAGKLIPFQQLMAMDEDDFYGGESNPGYDQHYGQSRYLCFYLQEKGLLVKFYQEFVANAKSDPTGFETLKRVLGEKDMDKFKTKWEKFILELRTR